VGVSDSELALRLADVIAAQCEGTHWAELARAREVAKWLDALGLHIPGLLGDMARQGHATCQACQRQATRLFRVRQATGTRGRALLERCRVSQETLLTARDAETSRLAKNALRQLFTSNGIDVCFACAAAAIAEARIGHARTLQGPEIPPAPAQGHSPRLIELNQQAATERSIREAVPSDAAIEAEVSVLLREFAARPDTDGAWVTRRTAAEVRKDHKHVYAKGKQRLLGATFTEEGKEFCIEELGPR
jgi:hypothetical protein